MKTHTAHTPGPWRIGQDSAAHAIWTAGNVPASLIVAIRPDCTEQDNNRQANAARIVACVNSCEGIADPAQEIAALRARSNNVPAMCAEVEAQRAEIKSLRDALADIAHGFIVDTGEHGLGAVRLDMDAMQAIATAAIARATDEKGGK